MNRNARNNYRDTIDNSGTSYGRNDEYWDENEGSYGSGDYDQRPQDDYENRMNRSSYGQGSQGNYDNNRESYDQRYQGGYHGGGRSSYASQGRFDTGRDSYGQVSQSGYGGGMDRSSRGQGPQGRYGSRNYGGSRWHDDYENRMGRSSYGQGSHGRYDTGRENYGHSSQNDYENRMGRSSYGQGSQGSYDTSRENYDQRSQGGYGGGGRSSYGSQGRFDTGRKVMVIVLKEDMETAWDVLLMDHKIRMLHETTIRDFRENMVPGIMIAGNYKEDSKEKEDKKLMEG